MSAKDWFGGLFPSSERVALDLISPFKLKFKREGFCEVKTEILFKRILEGCYSRAQGATGEAEKLSLFDSFEKSSAPSGLISILARAMRAKNQIGIIYENGVVRLADTDEKNAIIEDYKKTAKSSLGVLVDFTNYALADLVFGYMSIIYDIIDSMNTQVGVSKALQIKINALRGTVSVAGKEEPIQQAKDINKALKEGKSVLLDKNDEISTVQLDSEPIEKAINFVFSLIASDLSLSLSFISGALTTGMSATGEADANKDEYGFLNFFNSIFKPTCDRLYKWNLEFISDDWRYFNAMIGSLLIVENSSLLSQEQKRAFADRIIPKTAAKK